MVECFAVVVHWTSRRSQIRSDMTWRWGVRAMGLSSKTVRFMRRGSISFFIRRLMESIWRWRWGWYVRMEARLRGHRDLLWVSVGYEFRFSLHFLHLLQKSIWICIPGDFHNLVFKIASNFYYPCIMRYQRSRSMVIQHVYPHPCQTSIAQSTEKRTRDHLHRPVA